MRLFGLGLATIGLATIGLASCSGGGEPANAPPTAVITSPAEGATFRAGDTLTFAGSAADVEDGSLGASSLTWWAELRHDAHSHPFVPPTAGGSGNAKIPTRGETSDNIFYRLHLRATDSAGLSAEVTRDVLPQKAQVTLLSQPAGLQLTLDGQPVTAPHTFTGVVGVERDLGAAQQVSSGRTYQFSGWSDGGAAQHTISTQAADRTYTATFIDAGPAVNSPPTVALTAPANGSNGATGVPINLTATAVDSDGAIASVQFLDGSAVIGTDTTAPYSVAWTPSTPGSHALTARATDNAGAAGTSAVVSVAIDIPTSDMQPPLVGIASPAAFADALTGTITFSADATDNVGVAEVEFQLDAVPLAIDRSSPYSTTVDTTLHAPGQHVLRVRASDFAGNRSPWISVPVRFAGSRVAPASITRTVGWATGLISPTAFTQLPDGRLLVAQQEGRVRVVLSDGTVLATPMLSVSVDATNERGLLGVTAHPDFASNGLIYIYYTTAQGGTHNRISRFTASGNSAGGEVVLADLPPLQSGIHNGGAMHFGADGKLYVAVGDNAVGANSQNPESPLGKLLRFNDDGTIPGDNPYCTRPQDLACAAWAQGLRNPFTFAVQPGTGRLHINDVGQGLWEEINVAARGANFGWPGTEGPTTAAGVSAPLFAYPHARAAPSPPGSGPGGFFVGICIIGGAFYPASGPFPAPWRGGYFFTDFGERFIGFIDLDNDNAAYSFGSVSGIPVGMLTAADGALLVLTRSGIERFTSP